MVSNKGIHVGPSKIEVVNNWETPKTPTEVRQFLGLDGYYQRYIKNFYRIAKPLTMLTQKEVKFNWEDNHEASNFPKAKRHAV